ncbi:hypothetical protein NL676_039692 [Syzygium grande]|nr:hypothetical protein NL676_039692 [Syzygium grande]
MPDVDIYGNDDPWEIFDVNLRESFYVFTRLKIIKSRVKRTADSGTWSNGSTPKVYALPSSSIQAADVEDNNHNDIGYEDYQVMHYNITFEENPTGVGVPLSS